MDIPGHTAGHIAYFGDVERRAVGVLRRHAVRGRLRSPVRRHAAADVDVVVGAGRAAARHARVLRPRVHARQHPLRARGRAGQRRLWERQAREQAKRDRGEPTLPSTIGEERLTNPFLRARFRRCARRPHRMRAAAAGDVETFAALRAWKNAF
jgi:hydroxyacylglutathione hydrolase